MRDEYWRTRQGKCPVSNKTVNIKVLYYTYTYSDYRRQAAFSCKHKDEDSEICDNCPIFYKK